MSVSSPAALLSLVLCAGSGATAQPQLPDCEAFPSRLELPTEPTGKVQQVCISPELSTTLRFDSWLVPGSLELQEHERFEDVAPGKRSFNILPPADLQPGERFKVAVRFADGAAPTSATFELVGHPALGARQVDVYRHKRTVEDYQKELQEEREKSQRLGQELERMRLEQGPGGITGLIVSGSIVVGDQSTKAESIARSVSLPASNALVTDKAISYRFTTRAEGVVRVAVAVELTNPGTLPWMVKGAVLMGKNQEVKPLKLIWQLSPIPPNTEQQGLVIVETELTAREARGPFTLKLWDESGKRVVTLGNVTFP